MATTGLGKPKPRTTVLCETELSQGETPKAKEQLKDPLKDKVQPKIKASKLVKERGREQKEKETRKKQKLINVSPFLSKQENLEAGRPKRKLGQPCETELSQGATPKETRARPDPTPLSSSARKEHPPKNHCETELSQGEIPIGKGMMLKKKLHCETELSQGATPIGSDHVVKKKLHCETELSQGATPIGSGRVGKKKIHCETELSQGAIPIGSDLMVKGKIHCETELSQGVIPIGKDLVKISETGVKQGRTVRKSQGVAQARTETTHSFLSQETVTTKPQRELHCETELSQGATPIGKEKGKICETELSQGETPKSDPKRTATRRKEPYEARLSQWTTPHEKMTRPDSTCEAGVSQEGTPSEHPEPDRGRIIGRPQRKSVGAEVAREIWFPVIPPTPSSKRSKRRAMIAIHGKIRSWIDVLKATWAVWTPQSLLLQELKAKIHVSRLPTMEEEHTQLLIRALQNENTDAQWRVDLDMLLGLVIVIEQKAFRIIWDKFAFNLGAWLRGKDTRQAARRMELKQRLEMRGPLEEELAKWKGRKPEREEINKVGSRIQPEESSHEEIEVDSQLITHEMVAEEWQSEETMEEPRTTSEVHEDVTNLSVGGQTGADDQEQLNCDSETLPMSVSGMEDMQDEPEVETQKQNRALPKEVIETQENDDSGDKPVYNPRKRARLMESDSEEEIASGTIGEQHSKELVGKIVKELGVPNSSQWIETIHALLIVKKLAATVYEPMLAVKNDELADVRAALWPSFRHLEAGRRDGALNECVKEYGVKDTKKLFTDTAKKLSRAKITRSFKEDVDSSLIAKPIYKIIGLCDGTVPTCNIVQQCASSMNSELHFEFQRWIPTQRRNTAAIWRNCKREEGTEAKNRL